MRNRKTNSQPQLKVDDFSFGEWQGQAYKFKNKQPVVLFVHQKPVAYPYMVLSRTNELFFKTYREAQDYFKTIQGDY